MCTQGLPKTLLSSVAACLAALLPSPGLAAVLKHRHTSVPCDFLEAEAVTELEEYGIAAGCPKLERDRPEEEEGVQDKLNCSGKAVLAFNPVRPTAESERARATFLQVLNSGNLTDVLFTGRHRCCKIHGMQLPVPGFFRKFDWYALGKDSYKHNQTHPSPRTVYVDPQYMLRNKKRYEVFENLTKLKPGERRLLVVGNDDLQHTPAYSWLEDLFTSVLTEAKDKPSKAVGTLPMGLNDWYMQVAGTDHVKGVIKSVTLQGKDKGVFAAWGKVWSLLDSRMESRKAAKKWLDTSCIADKVMLNPQDYWRELARHRFQLSVPGYGVQSSKLVEGLLVMTIPIVLANPTMADLKAAGWPLVIVNSWNEITPDLLYESHKALSPQLEAFRLRLTAEGAFEDLLINL